MSYALVAIYEVKSGKADAFQAALEAMVKPSLAESGCIGYRPHRSLEDPNMFFLYEEYVDEDAIRAHVDTPHFDQHVNREARPLIENRTVVRGAPLA